jgi:hypothetical protein
MFLGMEKITTDPNTPIDPLEGRNFGMLALNDAERRIFMEIRNSPGVFRESLVGRLGLSKAMLSKTVRKFIDAGVVVEERAAPRHGQAGQPPLQLQIRDDAFSFVGINLSTRGGFAAVSDIHGRPRWLSSPEPLAAGPEAQLEQALVLTAAALQNARPGAEIGMYIPGLVSSSGRILEITPRQREIPFGRVIDALRAAFPDNPVSYGQADLIFQALKPQHYGQVLFHCSLGDGIGGQVFDTDRSFRGGFNQAGNVGALAPGNRPRPSVADLADHLGVAADSLTVERLAEMHQARDARLMTWIADRAPRLSMPFSAVAQLINPNKIVLGGNFPVPILKEIAARIELNVFDTPDRLPVTKPEIIVADVIGEQARALAAAALPLARFLFDGFHDQINQKDR